MSEINSSTNIIVEFSKQQYRVSEITGQITDLSRNKNNILYESSKSIKFIAYR